MVDDIKTRQEIPHKINLVHEFVDGLYWGRQHYKERIAFIANTLNGVIEELKTVQERR